MSTITIGNRPIGRDHEVLVIAEIGVNHDGSVERALELVAAARESGADAAKLQIFTADRLMHRSSRFAEYQKDRCAEADPVAMLRRYELPRKGLERICAAMRQAGLLPLATPFSPEEVDVIEELDLPAIKIASPDLVNRPLLQRAAKSGKPLLISTGAATMDEIAVTAGWLAEWEAPFALLHCVSSYPTPADQANLCWIGELAARFDIPIGYSDHTTEPWAGALAVAAGASLIEKHLTYDRAALGPDHSASSDPAQFAQYTWMIRGARRLRGSVGKHVLDIENDVRQVSRQSLVLRTELRKGQVLCEHHLTVQRPGTGIPAAQVQQAIGRKLRRSLDAGDMLQWDMLSDAA